MRYLALFLAMTFISLPAFAGRYDDVYDLTNTYTNIYALKAQRYQQSYNQANDGLNYLAYQLELRRQRKYQERVIEQLQRQNELLIGQTRLGVAYNHCDNFPQDPACK